MEDQDVERLMLVDFTGERVFSVVMGDYIACQIGLEQYHMKISANVGLHTERYQKHPDRRGFPRLVEQATRTGWLGRYPQRGTMC